MQRVKPDLILVALRLLAAGACLFCAFHTEGPSAAVYGLAGGIWLTLGVLNA